MSTNASPVRFGADHFTVCLLTRIYNSTKKEDPNDPTLDLCEPKNRASMIAFIDGLTKDDVSHVIFLATHFPGDLDIQVEFPREVLEEASRVLALKFGANASTKG